MFQQLSLLCASAKEENLIGITGGRGITGFPRPQPYVKPSLTPFKTLFQYLAVQMLLNKDEFPSDDKLGCKAPTRE